MLRERLEMMTQQIKQEMADELQKEKLKRRKSVSVPSSTEGMLNNSNVVINGNEGDAIPVNPNCTTVDEAQMNINGPQEKPTIITNGHSIVKNGDEKESLLTTNVETVTEIAEKEAESDDKICPAQNIDRRRTEDDVICDTTKSEEARTESPNNCQDVVAHVMTDSPSNRLPEHQPVDLADEKKSTKSRTPTVKVDTLKRKKKLKKTNEKPTFVEIPFCSHNQHLTGQDQATFTEVKENMFNINPYSCCSVWSPRKIREKPSCTRRSYRRRIGLGRSKSCTS